MKKINQFIKDNYPFLLMISVIIFIILFIVNLFILDNIAQQLSWLDVNVYTH